MTTRLDTPLKRELDIDGQPFTLTISRLGLKLTPKGRRKGQELSWEDLVSGDAALATALSANLRELAPREGRSAQRRRRVQNKDK